MRRLIVLSCQRSGTNWLQDVLGSLPGCYAVREIFNPVGAFGLEGYGGAGLAAVRAALGDASVGERSAEVVAWMAADAERALRLLEGVAGGLGRWWLAAVVFMGHLPAPALRALLAAPEVAPVLLARRQLPRYVSLAKAREIGAWRFRDTTEVRPEIDAEAFLAEAREASEWFAEARSLVPPGRPVARLSFDRHVVSGGGAAVAAIRAAHPWVPEPPPGHAYPSRFFRQDRNADVFDGIANGPALRADLVARGALEAALAEPL